MPEQKRTWAGDLGPFLTLGLQLALAVVVFFFAGKWCDDQFGTAPWCTLAGVVIGIAGGLTQFLRTALRMGRKSDEEAADKRDDH